MSKSISTATQATPSISVSSSGLITASATQSAGYVSSGTKSATQQLTTQSGTTITPGTSQKTACASGRYTTGTIYVAGDSDLKASNIKSGINIFGVTGTLEQGSEVVVLNLDRASYYRTSGDYREYRVYYDGTIPATPSSGGEWQFVSYMMFAELEYSGGNIICGGGMTPVTNTFIFHNDGMTMTMPSYIGDISTSYFIFRMYYGVYEDYGDIQYINSGSHIVLANDMIMPV